MGTFTQTGGTNAIIGGGNVTVVAGLLDSPAYLIVGYYGGASSRGPNINGQSLGTYNLSGGSLYAGNSEGGPSSSAVAVRQSSTSLAGPTTSTANSRSRAGGPTTVC